MYIMKYSMILCGLLVAFFGLQLDAQVVLKRSVLSNGAVQAAGDGLVLRGTIGQSLVGTPQGSSLTANTGFWTSARQCDLVVTTLADSGPGSLREALACALTGERITFAVDGVISLSSGAITISEGVTIDGDAAEIFIDAQGNSRIFEISGTNPVTIRNIFFERGFSTEFGGAISSGAPLNLINCDFDNCVADIGGAVFVGFGDANIINTAFVGNQASTQAGAFMMQDGSATVINSIFYDNQGGGLAGAILGVNAPMTHTNVTVIGNTANFGGGYFLQDSPLTLQNSIVYGNTAGTSPDMEANQPVTGANSILSDLSGSGLVEGVNNILVTDPLLRDPANDDFGIQPFSIAHGNADPFLMPLDAFDANLDGVTDEMINFDFDRIERGQGATNFDIGAMETQGGNLTVINTNNAGIGSLRSAIAQTNTNVNLDRIVFAIPGAGPHEILLQSQLPPIEGGSVVIDGSTQAGTTPEMPMVTVNGTDQVGVVLNVRSDNVSIANLRLTNAGAFRLIEVVDADFATIAQNVLFSNTGQDHLLLQNATECSVFNNRIGVDLDGTRNTLPGSGIWMNNARNNRLVGNLVSGGVDGALLGMINGSDDNLIEDNQFGSDPSGSAGGNNVGVYLQSSSDNVIRNNQIANNVLFGVAMETNAQRNLLSANNFLCNGMVPIQIEEFSQGDIQPPVITRSVPGLLEGTALPNAAVDIFIQDTSDCSGSDIPVQGRFYTGLTANQNGQWSLSDPILTEDVIVTALQIDTENNTSAFAERQNIQCDLEVTMLPTAVSCAIPSVPIPLFVDSGEATFSWTGPGGFTSAEANPLASTPGMYNVRIQEGACTLDTSYTLVADTLSPDISTNSVNLFICAADAYPITALTATPNPQFSWSGPDGFSSQSANPSVPTSGMYTVTVTGLNGCTNTATTEVVVEGNSLNANFSAVVNGLEVALTNTTEGTVDSLRWDFGNGQTSIMANPTAQFDTPGTQNITLVAYNECGSDTLSQIFNLLLPIQDTVTFLAEAMVEGPTLDTVRVPIRVLQFENIASFQYTLSVADPSIARLAGVTGFNLPDLNEDDFNLVDDGTLTVAWFSGSGASPADSTIIFELLMEVTGTTPACTAIDFVAMPTSIEVGRLVGNAIVPTPHRTVSGSVCALPFADLVGQVYRENGAPLDEVEMECTDQPLTITDINGEYAFVGLQTGLDYTVRPARNTDPREGVTAIDLALIQRHILTLQPLNSPYKIIAADVDYSGSVGAIDLANIQRLILSKVDSFPGGVDSWRFVDAFYNFTDPTAPLSTVFPEERSFSPLLVDVPDADFVGMKLGDVNGTAMGKGFGDDLEVLLVERQEGNVRVIDFVSPRRQSIVAYQFDVRFDANRMQLLDMKPGVMRGLTDDFFGYHSLGEGWIPTLWYDPAGRPDGQTVESGEVLFSLHFLAPQQDVPTDECIWVGDRHLPAVGYAEDGRAMHIDTRYENGQAASQSVRLEAPVPNPFTDRTNLTFFLPEGSETDMVRFEVRDVLGRMVFQREGRYGAGSHTFAVSRMDLNESGWYTVTMRTGMTTRTQQILLQQ
jgi:parallel beta-helix repeat protein